MKTLLENVTSKDVQMDPFPHIVVENAVGPSLADQLLSEYPPMEILTKGRDLGSNERFNFDSEEVKKNSHVSDTWKSFIEAHASRTFFEQFVFVFRDVLMEIHPHLRAWWENPRDIGIGTKGFNSWETKDVLLSAFIAGNTPVTTDTATSVKIAHLDNVNKMYAGLFYLRSPEDDSEGGDFELYRYKRNRFKFHGQRLIDEKYIEVVSTVPYKHNTFVLLPNSLYSLHGVTPRAKTRHVRKFMNLVSEVKNPLLDLSPYKEGIFNKIRRRVRTEGAVQVLWRGLGAASRRVRG